MIYWKIVNPEKTATKAESVVNENHITDIRKWSK